MSDITLYHNPNCSKSRKTLELLEENGHKPQVVLYLQTPPSAAELSQIVSMLAVEPIDIVRTGEQEYRQEMQNYSAEQVFDAIVSSPKLLQRPIVVTNGKARIGRPPESVLDIL